MNPTTVNEVLDIIDNFLVANDEKSRALWNIITAMRGPDDGKEIVKKKTTRILRGAAFPKTAAKSKTTATHAMLGAYFSLKPLEEVDADNLESGYHFRSHTKAALEDLLELGRNPHKNENTI